jgi:hypothetical protein
LRCGLVDLAKRSNSSYLNLKSGGKPSYFIDCIISATAEKGVNDGCSCTIETFER